MKRGAEKILVYRLGSLGDTIVALPCLNLIRRTFPDASIDLLTNVPVEGRAAPLVAILRENFFSDTVRYPVGLRDPRSLGDLIRALRRKRYDAVIHLAAFRGKKHSLRDWLFFRLAGIPRIIGVPWKGAEVLPGGAYREEREAEYRHLAKRLRPLGDARVDEDAAWDLGLTAAEIAQADALLANAENRRIIALSCGTKWRTNDWEEERWLPLVKRLSREFPEAFLVLVGAREERERSDRMLAQWSGAGRNLCGQASPRVSAAILRRAEVFVGHDSGPLHLAACVGTRCVGIFSARNPPGRWFPRGKNCHVIYHQTDCFGCGLELCTIEAKRCIRSISVDEVFAAVRDGFARSQGGASVI